MVDKSTIPDEITPTFSVSAQGEALFVQLVANLITSFVAFLSFCILKRTWNVVFCPRMAIARNTPPDLPTRSCFSWIAPFWKINENEILKVSGLDALTYLRFLKMCLHLVTQMCILGLLILLPANYVLSTKRLSEGRRTFWDFLDINSIPSGSGYLFVHSTFTWAFSLLTIFHLHKFYAAFISAREFYMTSAGLQTENGTTPYTTDRNRNIQARTIIVSGIPPELCDEEGLSRWFTGLGVGRVQKAHLIRHHAPLNRAIATRTDALLSLERLCTQMVERGQRLQVSKQPRPQKSGFSWRHWLGWSHQKTVKSSAANSNFIPLRSAHKEPDNLYDQRENLNFSTLSFSEPPFVQLRPKMRVGAFGLCGPETDAISYFTAELRKWDATVSKLRKEVKEKSEQLGGHDTEGRTAFVTFYSQRSANVLAQTLNHSKIFTCVTRMAPEPQDVFWENISIHPMKKRVRLVAVQTLLVFMACFWAIPTSIASTLLSVEKLSSTFPVVRSIVSNSVILERFLEGLVPTWIISILVSWLPWFLRHFTQLQGTISLSGIEEDVFSRYFLFSLINVILVMSIGGTVWHASLDTILESHNILSLLGSSLPKVAAFFNNYVILQALFVVPVFDLLRLGSWFQIWRKLRYAKSPREKSDARLPPYLHLGEIYVGPTIIVIVGLLYSVIAPVILLLCVCYFSVTFFVHKYQLLYVYRPMYDTGGRIWPMVFRRMIAGLILFQSTMCGLLVLKDEPVAATLCLPTILATILFDRYCTAAYKSRAYFHSLDISPHEVHEVEEDAFVNPAFGFFDRRTPTLAENESLNDVVLSGNGGQRAQPEMRQNYYGVLEQEADPTGNCYPYWEPAVGGKLPELWIENHRLEQEVLGHATRRPPVGVLRADADAASWNSLNV